MSYSKSYYHIVFRTYRSERTLEEAHEKEMYMYIFAICKNKGTRLWRINSMPDHIHLLVSIPTSISVASFVKDIKQSAGNYLKEHRKEFPMFSGWADGYCSITYCERERDTIIKYIKNQKAHHSRTSLADEMRSLLTDAGIDINEGYFRKDWIE